jgi:hypothetical protein
MVADGAARRGPDKSVVSGEVTDDTADDGAAHAAARLGGSGCASASQGERENQGDSLH